MEPGVLFDSTNHPKRPKTRSQSQPASKERPAVARTLFGAERDDNSSLPIPKALTESLPTFDGKSEKFELFEDFFRNDIKMYPHLTELQKIKYFHSLLQGDALQAFCNIEDAKKESLEEIMTIFKRRFGDYLSMAKARCEWDALRFDPSTQKPHEFLDTLQKTALEAFGSKAQQFIDKAIYAKMPHHFKKILNRAYLEDKPYNDIVHHLEREMRLNGLVAPDEVNLVPLNKIEPVQTKSETKPAENNTQNTTQITKKGYCFYCNKFGHFKAESRKMRRDKWQQTRKTTAKPKIVQPPRLNAILVANLTKQKIAGMEPTRLTTRDLSDTSNEKGTGILPHNNRQPNSKTNKKTSYAAHALWGNSRRDCVFNRGFPHHIR